MLSAFLIVKNEGNDLPACLESLTGLVDETIVVDSGSTDDTLALAKARGARVYSRTFDGFAAQKQFALDQCAGDWVLSIDADERVTPALSSAIQDVLRSANANEGYEIQRNLYFLGYRLHHGGVGTDWPLRLFRRTKGKFLLVSVHERVEVLGPVGRLEAELKHLSYSSLSEYIAKCDHYTTLAAQDLYRKGRRFSLLDHLRPAWEVISRIVLHGAWLDGQPGLIYAALSAHAAWLRAIKLWDLQQRRP